MSDFINIQKYRNSIMLCYFLSIISVGTDWTFSLFSMPYTYGTSFNPLVTENGYSAIAITYRCRYFC
jgi:hypothetical protein